MKLLPHEAYRFERALERLRRCTDPVMMIDDDGEITCASLVDGEQDAALEWAIEQLRSAQ
jgi:hypothetical protein